MFLGRAPFQLIMCGRALCQALEKGEKDTRSKAVEALGAIRARPDIAVPALIAALKDDDSLRYYAARALQAYGAEAKAEEPTADAPAEEPKAEAEAADEAGGDDAADEKA